MRRRNFIKSSLTLPAATLLPASTLIGKPAPATSGKPLQSMGKRLKAGDTLGLIAPGYAVSQEKLKEAIGYVEDLGYVPYYTERIKGNHGYLSNTDEERLADLHHMFENKNVDGILCVRGGYGCTRLLPHIDWSIIQNNPKVFAGFSDITALLNVMNEKTGLICFHAPVGTTLDTDYNREQFQRVINAAESSISLSPFPYEETDKKHSVEYEPYTLNPGMARGTLSGGNLSLLAAMTGTPYEPDYTGKIVFIEEIEEEPYRIDRMLTQLLQSRTFSKAAGIALGVFAGCNQARNPDSFTLRQVLTDLLGDLEIPTGYGFPIGHIDENATLPLGGQAEINTEEMTVKILKSSVI